MINQAERISQLLQGTGYKGGTEALYRVIASDSNKDPEYQYLANGSIICECSVERDNGADVERVLRLHIYYSGDSETVIEIPERLFETRLFSDYLPLGFRPAIGRNSRAYILDSIRAQDAKISHDYIFEHTGWRCINGSMVFLHGAGAVGKDNVKVELEPKLQTYRLHEPVSPQRSNTVKKFLEVAPHSVTLPLLAFAFLSPVNSILRKLGNEPAFLLFLLGHTGSKKSTLTALTLCFFGDFTNKSLPNSFKDTANSIEKTGFLLKDVLTAIDDYHPGVNKSYASKLEATAQEVARMYGDRTGKNRMNADGSLRINYPPRGNAILTGEDVPAIGESGQARLLTIEISESDINIPLLTDVQNHHEHLSEVMSEYISFLSDNLEDLQKDLPVRWAELREKARNGGHDRISEAIAHLQIAIELWSLFEVQRGYLTQSARDSITSESWDVFTTLAKKQNQYINQDKPSALFVDALSEMLQTRKVDLVDIRSNSEVMNLVGWKDEKFAYLLSDSVYNAIYKFYSERGQVFPLRKVQLVKHLADDKIILPGEKTNYQLKKIRGKTRRVVQMPLSILMPGNEDSQKKTLIKLI